MSNLVDAFKRLNYARVSIAQLVNVAGKLLPESKGSSVLSVGSTNLYDIVKLSSFGVKHVYEGGKLRKETLVDLHDCGDVHD